MKTMLKTGGIVAAVLAAFFAASPSGAQKMKEPMGGMKGMMSFIQPMGSFIFGVLRLRANIKTGGPCQTRD